MVLVVVLLLIYVVSALFELVLEMEVDGLDITITFLMVFRYYILLLTLLGTKGAIFLFFDSYECFRASPAHLFSHWLVQLPADRVRPQEGPNSTLQSG